MPHLSSTCIAVAGIGAIIIAAGIAAIAVGIVIVIAAEFIAAGVATTAVVAVGFAAAANTTARLRTTLDFSRAASLRRGFRLHGSSGGFV